jgi:hypothetical protein
MGRLTLVRTSLPHVFAVAFSDEKPDSRRTKAGAAAFLKRL